MKAIKLIAAVAAFVATIAYAEERGNMMGTGSSRASACSNAKFKVNNLASRFNAEVTYIGSCDCEGDDNSNSSVAWACYVDYSYYFR